MRTALLTVLLVSLVACSGRSIDRYVRSGDAYMRAHKYQEAVIEYRNAVRLDPRSAALQRKLGAAYMAARDFVGAAIAFETVWAMEFDPIIAVEAGDAHLAFGDLNGATAIARQVLQMADTNVDAHLLLARALLQSGDLRSAERELRIAIGLAPANPLAYELLGELHRRAGNPALAESLLVKAATLSPKDAKPRVALARLYMDEGRIDEGEHQVRLALDASPDDPDANRAYASLLIATDRCEDAEPYWQKVAKHSDDASGALSLADYYVFASRPDDALRVLTPLTKDRDEGGAARMRVASIFYDRGDSSAAEKIVDQLLAHEPDNATALVLKARLASDRGDRKAAVEYASHASRVDPTSQPAQELLTSLQPQPAANPAAATRK